jgi:hypothetical protein
METNNKIAENCSSKYTTFYDFVNLFFLETIEVAIVLFILLIIQGKKLELFKLLKSSIFIGLIMGFIDMYNETMKKSIKLGMFGSIGSKLL